ncbi:MAG: hypothetical protein N3H30_02955 [Candidatus Micrarchaeota archaeon]|nr:hypothetical protein [Candidatus Micrarchaeota archaeon]
MQEFEKKESNIRLTVDLGSRPKKVPAMPARKDGSQFANMDKAVAAQNASTTQKGTQGRWAPVVQTPAININKAKKWSNGTDSPQNNLLAATASTLKMAEAHIRKRPDLEARKPSPDRYTPKEKQHKGNIATKIINALAVAAILAGMGIGAKICYEEYASKRLKEIAAVSARIENIRQKYAASDSLSSAFASLHCGSVADSIQKIKLECGNGDCSQREISNLNGVISQFNDFCGTAGSTEISKFEDQQPK